MTQLLELAVATARGLADEAQDEIARVILRLAGHTDEDAFVPLTVIERAAIAASRAAAVRGEFASDAEVLAVWDEHGG